MITIKGTEEEVDTTVVVPDLHCHVQDQDHGQVQILLHVQDHLPPDHHHVLVQVQDLVPDRGLVQKVPVPRVLSEKEEIIMSNMNRTNQGWFLLELLEYTFSSSFLPPSPPPKFRSGYLHFQIDL